MTDEVLIEVKGLRKSFGGNEVLQGLDAQIHRGEVVVVIGPSGSGKSTFLRCLNRLEEPSGGQIIFEGSDICAKGADINLLRQKMGMVFQQFNLFNHLTVLENIVIGPKLVKKCSPQQAEQEAMKLLERIGLADKAREYPSRLSGGQKQRIAIARVFLKNPPILILDEATSALDTVTEQAIQKSFDQLSRGRTTLVVAHRLSTVRNSDCIVVIEHGEIEEKGSHEELLEQKGRYYQLYTGQFQLS